mmetsp:Transcript_10456/g.18463  ORF Transcript_10456/g.18463 Transcript_10456/m.18463 type:complete len:415 (+) Transcript_10456:446-1690(+)
MGTMVWAGAGLGVGRSFAGPWLLHRDHCSLSGPLGAALAAELGRLGWVLHTTLQTELSLGRCGSRRTDCPRANASPRGAGLSSWPGARPCGATAWTCRSIPRRGPSAGEGIDGILRWSESMGIGHRVGALTRRGGRRRRANLQLGAWGQGLLFGGRSFSFDRLLVSSWRALDVHPIFVLLPEDNVRELRVHLCQGLEILPGRLAQCAPLLFCLKDRFVVLPVLVAYKTEEVGIEATTATAPTPLGTVRGVCLVCMLAPTFWGPGPDVEVLAPHQPVLPNLLGALEHELEQTALAFPARHCALRHVVGGELVATEADVVRPHARAILARHAAEHDVRPGLDRVQGGLHFLVHHLLRPRGRPIELEGLQHDILIHGRILQCFDPILLSDGQRPDLVMDLITLDAIVHRGLAPGATH